MATKTSSLAPAKARKQTAAADQAVTTPPQPANGNVSPSHRDILRQLYSSMLKCRTAAKALQRLRRDPQLGGRASCSRARSRGRRRFPGSGAAGFAGGLTAQLCRPHLVRSTDQPVVEESRLFQRRIGKLQCSASERRPSSLCSRRTAQPRYRHRFGAQAGEAATRGGRTLRRSDLAGQLARGLSLRRRSQAAGHLRS